MRTIKTNQIMCVHCLDIIESENTHDFKRCSCKAVAVDGGLDYLKRLSKSENDYIELSETIFDEVNKVFCICGYSSSGKDSITNIVSKELNIPTLVSHTTRPMRDNEVNGETYHFISDTEFKANENNFLEQRHYDTVYGTWRYGLHSSEIINKPYSLFIVDRQGIEELSKVIGEDKIVSIFIEVSEEELKRRQALRGDSVEEFKRRIKFDINRFKGFISDYIVYNDDLDIAVQNVKNIIVDEMSEECI